MLTLAASVGSGVVQAAGSDTWAVFRSRLARLLGRADRRLESVQLERLDHAAERLAAAGPAGSGELERTRGETVAAWRTRTVDLLQELDAQERARLAAALQALLDDLAPARGSAAGGVVNYVFNGPSAVISGDHNAQTNHFGSQP
ncbi:hypothetical protein ACGFX4_34130 [Kitasatospora sp. NPDC048365]|uniref:hypothetical protein n=1 Tax=Kitasatospora sp. NPDC048365 TaxID=3364050 RepID=UPI00371E9DBC